MNRFALPGTRRHQLLAALAMLVLQGGAGAAGQVNPGGTMPEALKGIRQASLACRSADLPAAAAAGIPARPDMRCAIEVSTVQQKMQRPGTVLIDLRTAADYEAYHINGAMQASLADLHSKPYWREKTTLLVGNGKAERELYAECARLKQMGYKDVGVLRGGMPAWLAASQPVLGQAPAPSQLGRLAAAEFWQESQSRDNLVILSPEQATLRTDLASAVVLPRLDVEAMRKAVKQRTGGNKDTMLAAVIVVAEASTPLQQVEQIRRALQPLPVLIYTDTHKAFTQQMAVQKAIWTAQARGPKQPGCGQ